MKIGVSKEIDLVSGVSGNTTRPLALVQDCTKCLKPSFNFCNISMVSKQTKSQTHFLHVHGQQMAARPKGMFWLFTVQQVLNCEVWESVACSHAWGPPLDAPVLLY